MSVRSSWRRIFGLLCGCALLYGATTTASAQLPDSQSAPLIPAPPPVDANQRLERLEKLNDDLTRKLQELQDREARRAETPASFGPPAEAQSKTPADKGSDAKKDAAPKTGADKSYVIGESLKMDTTWKHGMVLQTPDNAFRFSVGGTVQFDMGWFAAPQDIVNSVGTLNNYADPGQALSDGMDFRRARIRFNGTAYEVAEFFAQYDFAQSIDLRRRTIGVTAPTTPTMYDLNPAEGTQFNEVWVGITKIPLLGAIHIGHHREGLNWVTSTQDRNQTWMERGLLFDAFNGDFNFSNGITMTRTYWGDRAYTLLGFFENNSRNFSSVGDGNYAYDIRATALPIWDPDNEHWAHIGVDYSYRNLTQNQVRYRARPLVRVGSGFQVNNIFDTGTIFSRDAQQIANLEFASCWGPWTVASDVACSWVTNAYTGGLPPENGKLPKGVVSQGTYFAQAAYAELLYFLTPDHRGYRKDRPGYERVVPRENFFFVDGDSGPIWSRGAWEVGVRYDYLDLTNGGSPTGINGGIGQSVTFAVNWYLNPNTRFQVNYFVLHREFAPSDTAGRVNGELQGLGVRVNMDF